MGAERTQTIRQEIIAFLKAGPLTIRDISQSVGVMEKDVFHHLEFIEKTIGTQNKKIQMKPYSCMDCGFEFKNRKRFKKPGKCPICRSGRIAPAIFWIES